MRIGIKGFLISMLLYNISRVIMALTALDKRPERRQT
jgi:hypothetical protein